jgi:hypothetical protein
MSRIKVVIIVWVLLFVSYCAPVWAAPASPASPVRLIFVHHSTGGMWLADSYGGLGLALRNSNYYVSATNYGWGPDAIGDRTDIPDWPEWFTGPNSATIMSALFAETGQNLGGYGAWSRLSTVPAGTNDIIMFKSCYPNSALSGNPTDVAALSLSSELSVANAKAVYANLLNYFQTRQDKLFVVITAPPLMSSSTSVEEAANARAFNNWLVHNWLASYSYNNVVVFDYYNVLTDPENHHRWHNGAEEHMVNTASNTLFYPSGDDHPSPTGQQKATGEFIPLLNSWYQRWQNSSAVSTSLYFPHCAHTDSWRTEICLLAKDQTMQGTLIAFSQAGSPLQSVSISLPARGRQEINVGTFFSNPSSIGYLRLDTNADAGNIAGYVKFYVPGQYRVAVPATTTIPTDDLQVSHIASTGQWWTGLSLVNTTATGKTLTITFDDASTRTITLAASEHKAFTIASLFSGQPQPNLHSAVISNAAGVIGLELFGSRMTTALHYLSGILLDDRGAYETLYLHVANDMNWWTGIVAYNMSDEATTMTITPYQQDGTALDVIMATIPGRTRYVGTASSLDLPAQTGWLHIDSPRLITGFELFGTTNGKMLAGYSALGIKKNSGIFAKLETDGWTGIALVNPNSYAVLCTLVAHDDAGNIVATRSLSLPPYAKIVGMAESLFAADISTASYVRYQADVALAGFQLNGSTDGMLLDGLPGL